MKINRSKGSLQSELAKMLEAGKENVESNDALRANTQDSSSKGQPQEPPAAVNGSAQNQPHPAESQAAKNDASAHRPNAAQRREVPDRNAKYAGEPIKSVGCRMPQSLYARMLQYKAMNDTQLNRITLNDIIIEAVDNFLETRL